MSEAHQFGSFKEFYPFYLSEHRSRTSRLLHYTGTIVSNCLLIYLLITQNWAWIPMVLVCGYGPAWVGHFFIEKNRPATFKHPLWSLMGDYKMLWGALTGRLQQDLADLPQG